LRDKKSKKNIRKKYIAKISLENFISKIKNLYTNDWFYIFVTYFATHPEMLEKHIKPSNKSGNVMPPMLPPSTVMKSALESTIDLYWNMQALKGIILKLII